MKIARGDEIVSATSKPTSRESCPSAPAHTGIDSICTFPSGLRAEVAGTQRNPAHRATSDVFDRKLCPATGLAWLSFDQARDLAANGSGTGPDLDELHNSGLTHPQAICDSPHCSAWEPTAALTSDFAGYPLISCRRSSQRLWD
ncbi:hypothetical protein ACWEVD_01860 [Nocardia thailandica]